LRRFVNRLFAWNKPPTPDPQRSTTATGRLGEQLAERYLRKQGYRLLFRDYHPNYGGQVDLVMKAPNQRLVVFVEVKTRRVVSSPESPAHPQHNHPLRPSDNLSPHQKRRLRQAADEWISQLPDPETPSRIDVVEVLLIPNAPPEIHHLVDALLLEPIA
jgi:putative endonuclease